MKLVMWLMASWEKPYKKDTAGRCAWNFHWNNNKNISWFGWIQILEEILNCCLVCVWVSWQSEELNCLLRLFSFHNLWFVMVRILQMLITILINDNEGEMTMPMLPIITWWARRRSWCEWREQRWVATRKSQHCRLCGRCQTSEGGCQVHVSREKHTKKWEKAFSCLFLKITWVPRAWAPLSPTRSHLWHSHSLTNPPRS